MNESFELEAALNIPNLEQRKLTEKVRAKRYSAFIQEARALAEALGNSEQKMDRTTLPEFGNLQFFST